MTIAPLPSFSGRVHRDGATVRPELGAGEFAVDPLTEGPTKGRARRWSYAAACMPNGSAVGAAMVDLGPAGTVFAWLLHEGAMHTWEKRILPGVGSVTVGGPGEPDVAHAGGLRVTISPVGGLTLRTPTLAADLVAASCTPAICVTPTEGGGWNATRKAAGFSVTGSIEGEELSMDVQGSGWSDWTAGRQDRKTKWRWAAGAGSDVAGRTFGFNSSTGMNGIAGEDVIWWDGKPFGLPVAELAPTDSAKGGHGDWTFAGDDWATHFAMQGVRAATENLLVVRSSYVQPIGTYSGSLPHAEGAREIGWCTGVTEDHMAVW